MRFIFFLVAVLLGSHLAQAQKPTQGELKIFQKSPIGRYFLADMSSPATKIELGWGSNSKGYNVSPVNQDERIFLHESNLGVVVPFLSKHHTKQGKSAWWSVSFPLYANIWIDFTEPITGPVLNTDFRYSLFEINYVQEINWKFVKNFAVKWIPFSHESTHIGDELTIYRSINDFPIVRVDVSYESTEFMLSLNDPAGSSGTNYAFRMGSRILLTPRLGYYRMSSYEGNTSKLNKSRKWFEYYFQYQFQHPIGSINGNPLQFVVSSELRNRIQYGYPYYMDDPERKAGLIEMEVREQRRWCYNGYAGLALPLSEKTGTRIGLYLRYYHGINPHGQFRNIPSYQFAGLSLIFEN